MTTAADQIIVALDGMAPEQALAFCQSVDGLRWVKVGLELFVQAGPEVIAQLREQGLRVFLDLKFHDIPNTVAGAVRSATATGASILNVHASGGLDMMRAAAEAATEGAAMHGVVRPIVAAVTVLTSMNEGDLEAVGQQMPPRDQVIRLAKLAKSAGLDGIVCSPKEAAAVRELCGDSFVRIVPGIRPSWSATNDQKRFTTPKQALSDGASYIVIGRPITQAEDPVEAASRITAELEDE